MTEERKIVIPVEVDGSGAANGFDQVKQSAAGMAQAVGKSAQDAGKAIDGIGTSTEGLTVKQRAVLESIKRTTIGTTEGKAALQEYKAGLAGVTEAAAPYIAKLKEAEHGQVQLGMSAKATANALRGVPAQFTDIITSLQGGQKPLTVLLQQGGQLKDMLGGVGPALRAVGSYIFGLISPLTLAAGAVGVLAYAYMQGSKETEAYNRALILSGNIAGTTASQMSDMARTLGQGNYTQGKAAETIAALAQSGVIAGDKLQKLAAIAIDVERATGQSISKTVDIFKELEKAPLEAAVKLNKEINFLTVATYGHIRSLEQQGRQADAARVAMDAYGDVMGQRAKQITENNGFLETSWKGVMRAATGAWDAMAGVGRDATGSQQLAALKKTLANREARGPLNDTPGMSESFEKGNKALRDQIALLERLNTEQGKSATTTAEQAKALQLKTEYDRRGEEFLTKQQKLKRELLKEETEGQALIAKGLITQAELTQRLNNIRNSEKFKESGAAGTGQNEVAAIRAKVLTAQQELARIQSGTPDAKLTEGEKLVIRIKEELTTTIKGQARAEKEKALVAAQSLAVVDRQVLTEQNYQKALKASEETLNKQVDAAQKAADSITEQAIQQEAVNANFGKSKTAIEQATLAQLKNQQAMAEASDRFSPAYVAAVNSEVAAQERKVKALQQAEFLQRNANLDESARALTEETRTLELQLSLMGRTQLERDKIIGQRQVEVKLAKELAEIEKLNLGAGPEADAKRAELRAKAAANAVIEGNHVASKAVLDEWQRTADSINNSLTDALLRGFESGKGFAQNLRDTLVNMFKTLVLRPIIQGVMAPVSGMVSQGINGLFGGSGGGLGNISSLFSGGSPGGMMDTAAGLFGGGSGIAGAGITAAETAATIAASSEALIAAGATVAEAGAAATALGGTMAAGAAGIGSAITAGLAAIGPIGWAALAVAAIYAMSSSGGGPKTEAGFADGLNIAGVDIGGNQQGSQRGDVAAAQKISDGISASYAALAKQLGLVKDKIDVGIFYSQDNAEGGTSLTQLQVKSSAGYDRSARLGGIENVARGDEALQAALAEETVRLLVDGLKASDLGQQFKDILNSLSQDAGADAMKLALDRISRAKSQQTALEDTLFQLTATDTEKLARAREMERAAIDPLNKALLESVYAKQDALAAETAATQAAKDAAQALQALADAQAKASAAAYAGLERSVAAQRKLAEAAQQAAGERVTEIKSIFDLLKANARELFGQVDATRDAGAEQGRQFIANALRNAQTTGYLPDQGQLSNAITDVRAGIDGKAFTSAQDRDFQKLVLASQLKSLSEIAGPQLTAAEQALKAAQTQVDQLDKTLDYWKEQIALARGQVEATTSVEEAVQKLIATLTGEKPGAGKAASASASVGGAAFGAGAGAAGSRQIVTALGLPFDLNGFVDSHLSDPAAIAAKAISLGLSQEDLANFRGQDPADVAKWFALQGVPSFAVGTPRLPADMLLFGHKDEAILPAPVAQRWRDNESGINQQLLAELRASREATEAALMELRAIKSSSGRMDKNIDQVTSGGGAMRTAPA